MTLRRASQNRKVLGKIASGPASQGKRLASPSRSAHTRIMAPNNPKRPRDLNQWAKRSPVGGSAMSVFDGYLVDAKLSLLDKARIQALVPVLGGLRAAPR
jgi:hypothetical protein